MTTIQAFIKRHPVLIYFVLTFALSWGGILVVIGGPGAIPSPSEQAMLLLPVAILVMLVGPSVVGLLLTGLIDGRAGLRDLLARLLKWRVGARWYAVALLTTPLLATAILLALSLTSPLFLPAIVTTDDKASLLLTGIGIGLVVGFLEELGWTGFAIPRLRRRHGVFTTGLIVGLLWAAWHFLVYFWGSGDASGAFSLALFLPEFLFLVGVLPVYRVLMVWVYDRTESLPVAMLMHVIHTASTTAILVPLATGASRVAYYLVLAAALWLVVAVVAVVNRGQNVAKSPEAHGGDPESTVQTKPHNKSRQPTWQRVTLLSVLSYEGIGALLGGSLLVAVPDGRLMDMPVEIMHGVFRDFLIPGFILLGLGVLTVSAFIAVLRRTRTDWLLAGLALGGLAVWFIVEIAILQELHWLHAMWGLPVIVGGLVALPLIPSSTMTTIQTFIKWHAILLYFLLAFVISWGGSFAVLGPKFIRGENYQPTDLPLALLAMLAGPSLAGVTLTAIVDGRVGLRELFARICRWRVNAHWYVVALLTSPVLILATLLLLATLVSPVFTPNFRALGIVVGLLAGFVEEIGWMGYAFPKMQLKHSALAASLILGVLHGTWHIVADYLGASGNLGIYWLPHFIAMWIVGMTAFRVLIVWVYSQTGSVLLTQLMHASSTGFLYILSPSPIAPADETLWYAVYAAVLWVVVAIVATKSGRVFSIQVKGEHYENA